MSSPEEHKTNHEQFNHIEGTVFANNHFNNIDALFLHI